MYAKNTIWSTMSKAYGQKHKAQQPKVLTGDLY